MLLRGIFRVDISIISWKTKEKILTIETIECPYRTEEIDKYNCDLIPKTEKNIYNTINNKIREKYPLQKYSIEILRIYQCTPFEDIKYELNY